MTIQKTNNKHDYYSGTFAMTEKLHLSNELGGIIDSSFRGIGQIFLINNPITGLVLVAAISFHSLWAGFLFLASAILATLTAKLLGYDTGVIRLGFFSFNGALFGVLGAVFLNGEWVLVNAIFTLLAAAMSVPVMKATIEVVVVKFDAPALSLCFGILGAFLLLLAPATAYGNANTALLEPVQRFAKSPIPALRAETEGSTADVAEGLFNATFRGISQVVLMDSVLVGVLIVIGIALATRIGALMAVLGSFSGALTGIMIGADGFEIYHGLWGYNGAVVAVGLFGIVLNVSWKSLIGTLIASSSSALLYGALSQILSPYGIIPLSLPLVIVIIGAVFAFKDSKLTVIPISDYSNAEKRIRLNAAKK